MKAKEKLTEVQFNDYKEDPIVMGPYASHLWRTDPKHLTWSSSRYKFCSKLLSKKKEVIEIGCGDSTMSPIVAQVVDKLYCVDYEPLLLKDNVNRITKNFSNIEFSLLDITKEPFKKKCDAVYSLDVLEHIEPDDEEKFFINACKSLKDNGICIIGTPNKIAELYDTSKTAHVNLKTCEDYEKLLDTYFVNGFLFSMNDEVIHTGFYPMAHYLIMVGVGIK